MRPIKRSVLFFVLIVFILSSLPAFGANLGLGLVKQELLFGRVFKRPFEPISPRFEWFNEKVAYNLQSWLVDRMIKMRDAKVIGYKVAFTSPPSQKKFGTNEPAYGVLLDYMELKDNTQIDHTKIMKSFVEVEVGFRFAKDIVKPVKDTEELQRYVDGAFPAVELPAIRFTTLKGVKAADIIADDAGTSYFISGKVVDLNTVDLGEIVGTLSKDGEVVRDGNSKAVLGSPWNALLWVVNKIIDMGGVIKEGDIVITGTMTPLYPLAPGKYSVTYGKLGNISFIVK